MFMTIGRNGRKTQSRMMLKEMVAAMIWSLGQRGGEAADPEQKNIPHQEEEQKGRPVGAGRVGRFRYGR